MGGFEQSVFSYLVLAGFISAPIVFFSLFFVAAPYGRHGRSGWGPTINSVTGWVIMESVAVIAFGAFFIMGVGVGGGVVWIFFAMWQIHYVHRALIFPFRMQSNGKRNPVAIVLMAIIFNVYNGYLNGRYLGTHADRYDTAWLTQPCFIVGVLLFFVGMAINIHSDQILFRLRQAGKRGYRVPFGGMYRFVSCPNYLGEILQWTGWAVATWSLPGLVFAVWTAANLVPRARTHHLWYRDRFPNYPAERKAIVPWIY